MAETPEPAPRIAPLPRSEWSRAEIDALDPMIPPPGSVYAERRKERGGAGGVNALALLVRHPSLARAFLEFNRHLLYESSLDERTRELVVLRVSWALGSEYEWGQHVPVALEAGISAEQIQWIIEGPDAGGWSALDAAVLRTADALLADGQVDDEAWSVLAAHWDDAELMDFVFTVGGYATLAMAFNAAELPLDADLEGFPHHDG
ncbi:MAG: carboxymuconolactone decarboxylase family protein [Acidimicrobiales bacterium]|nr:carboxymuconolactone decarboxylase family protein [Acidimicrobiales bacterium]